MLVWTYNKLGKEKGKLSFFSKLSDTSQWVTKSSFSQYFRFFSLLPTLVSEKENEKSNNSLKWTLGGTLLRKISLGEREYLWNFLLKNSLFCNPCTWGYRIPSGETCCTFLELKINNVCLKNAWKKCFWASYGLKVVFKVVVILHSLAVCVLYTHFAFCSFSGCCSTPAPFPHHLLPAQTTDPAAGVPWT